MKPLPGLVSISQSANNPYQSISLIIGKYEQKSVESDSTLYSIWHIKGHDYYEAAFDSIRDTIPGLIRNLRENLERTYKLTGFQWWKFRHSSIAMSVPGRKRRKWCSRKWFFSRNWAVCSIRWILSEARKTS